MFYMMVPGNLLNKIPQSNCQPLCAAVDSLITFFLQLAGLQEDVNTADCGFNYCGSESRRSAFKSSIKSQ